MGPSKDPEGVPGSNTSNRSLIQVRYSRNVGSSSQNTQSAANVGKPNKTHRGTPTGAIYPAGIPRSFLFRHQQSSDNQTGYQQWNQMMPQTSNWQQPTLNSPCWGVPNEQSWNSPNEQPVNYNPGSMLAQSSSKLVANEVNATPKTTTFGQIGNIIEPQAYSPTDLYDMDPTDNLLTSDQSEIGLKRLSAFQRLGPVTEAKRPKITVNVTVDEKSQDCVREVVDLTEIADKKEKDAKYTPVHLRPDVISSTNEVVVKFLRFWPWKKNLPARKSCTIRHSRSAMMLEQEQMAQFYDREIKFTQISVTGYPSSWTKEDVMDAVLVALNGTSMIPCFISFTAERCDFLVLRCRNALMMIHKLGFIIHKDEIVLTLTISVVDLSLNQIDFIPRLVLRNLLAKRYNDELALNLKGFTLESDVSHFLYFPLKFKNNQSDLVELSGTIEWKYLYELDLSNNGLTTIEGFDLPSTTPKLRQLNLANNCLDKVTCLLHCRNMSLKSIWLEGNPLCHNYIEAEHYVKVIKMIFPELRYIDNVLVQKTSEPPTLRRNYCTEDAIGITSKFLETFFPLIDSIDQRSSIENMYAKDAVLSITCDPDLRNNTEVHKHFRGLFLRARMLDINNLDCIEGAASITKYLTKWTNIKHDPLTFTVDVVLHNDNSTILQVSGIIKKITESLAEEEHMMSFTRTLVLYSGDNIEYKILNEMLHWTIPTKECAKNAFRVTRVQSAQVSLKLHSIPNDEVQQQLILIFKSLTKMDETMCKNCLVTNNWDVKSSLEYFTKLFKLNDLSALKTSSMKG